MSQSPAHKPDNNLHGILFMLGGVFVLSLMDVTAKLLVEAEYSPFQILAIRGWIITLCFSSFLGMRGQIEYLKTKRRRDYVIRALIGFCAPFLFFTALGTMPIADVVVIFFAAPFIMTALSIPLLKETVGRYRWTAIGIGFIGVVIVIQPSGGTFQIGAFYALGACLAYCLIQLMTRWMSDTEHPIQLVFYFNLGTAVIGTCALPFVWKPMPIEHIAILLVMACVAMLGHMLMTTAFTRAPVSVVVPFEYTALIWGTLFGFVIWSDFPANHVWIGAVIIIISGIYMVHREQVAKKSKLENQENP
ncbi:MAG: DMT family transporter [Rhodospirillales bacterium]|nr:DMT family transporter [Rhodospirillales bacterium]